MKCIIDFYNHIDDSVIEQYFADNNITKISQLESFGKVYIVESETEITQSELIESISADADQPVNLLSFTIDLVDNYTETTFDIEDEKNWWKVATINEIDFDQPTHTHKVRGSNSTVYIIDSGIMIEHPEFTNSNIELLHTFNGNFIDNNGHGTGLSSLIVGSTCSLANPKLKVVKVFDNTQPTYQSDMLIALDAVLNDYITNGKKVSVVNMSWSIPKNDYINAKIQYMINQGMYVIAAAGNSGMAIGDVTPASIPDVLTIGSYNQNLEPSAFSNYTGGSEISYTDGDVNHGELDGWAPGELIWAANKNGGYGYIAGTSAAAAITSSAFAYNVNKLAMDDGVIVDNIKFLNKNDLSTMSLGRYDLLNLSDSKYMNSVNRTATIHNSKLKDNSFSNYMLQAEAGTTIKYFIFNPINIRNITFTTPLPDYVSVDSYGFITISYPEITEPLINLPQVEFATNCDNDVVKHGIITFAILKQGYETVEELMSNYPDYFSDNELSYRLLDDGCCFTTGGNACTDTSECGIRGGYCAGSKASCGCVGYSC